MQKIEKSLRDNGLCAAGMQVKAYKRLLRLQGVRSKLRYGSYAVSAYMKHLAALIVLALVPHSANADGYALFSKHEELKAHVVVDVGDFEKVGATEILKLNSNCFQPTGTLGSWGYGKKAGLVLVDKSKTIRVALLESSIGTIKVETTLVLQVACPSEDSNGLPLDPQQRLQELKRQQELLQLQLERLRQQRQQQQPK